MDNKINDSDLKGLPQYTDFKNKHTNTCIKCDKVFTFRVYNYDDARFVRFCPNCRQSIRKGDYDIEISEIADC